MISPSPLIPRLAATVLQIYPRQQHRQCLGLQRELRANALPTPSEPRNQGVEVDARPTRECRLRQAAGIILRQQLLSPLRRDYLPPTPIALRFVIHDLRFDGFHIVRLSNPFYRSHEVIRRSDTNYPQLRPKL